MMRRCDLQRAALFHWQVIAKSLNLAHFKHVAPDLTIRGL
jgi:hypothetical protein